MRLVLLSLFLVVNFPVSAGSEKAYLILSSALEGKGKQPAWICLLRAGRCTHVKANQKMVSIFPGNYRLEHIDFLNEQHVAPARPIMISNFAPVFFKKPMKLKVEAAHIYFIGDLRLKRGIGHRYKVELDQNTSLIKSACVSAPDVFDKYPLANITNTNKLKYSCNGGDNGEIMMPHSSKIFDTD